jgi:hypothetical protein
MLVYMITITAYFRINRIQSATKQEFIYDNTCDNTTINMGVQQIYTEA